ncbi:MAG: ATP-binding protein [Candidatus Binataceae bacterium]
MAAREIASLVPLNRSSNRLRASVRLLFVCVLFILTSVLAASLVLHRNAALVEGQRRAEDLAFILSDHFTRTTSAIDTTLSQIALLRRTLGPATVWGPILESARSAVSGVAILAVVDAKGTVIASTIPQILGETRAETYLFRRLSGQADAGLVADPPLRGRISGQWVIPFGRRLLDADGAFAGAIVATLEPVRLRGFYRTIDVGREGFISVLHPNRSVLFREPSRTGDTTGERANENPLLAEQRRFPDSGFVRASLEQAGPIYLSAYRRTTNPELIIAVSLAESEALAEWRSDATIAASILAGFGILLIIAWRLITREFRARAAVERRIVAQAEELAAAMDRREQSDAALRASQAQFQSIMEHAPMMVSLRDLDGRFTFINRAYEAFAGQSEENILGRTVAELRSQEYSDSIAVQDRDVIERRRAVQWEMTIPKPHGERAVLVVKFPIYDVTGRVVSVGSILADITEQKRAETHVAQAQRIEAVGQLTGGIAHDFNNLLTSILLNADVLATVIEDENIRPMAEAVRQAAERGADLTRRLLAFGRRQMLEPRPTNVKELLASMEPLMYRTLGEHIEISCKHAADLWPATVDPSQLENAVLNLAVNARDAMPDGGRITIETLNAVLDAHEAEINPEVKPGDYVVVAVHDTGCGMPPDVVERAFEPFFTTKDVGKGTGLGLSMVYGFVKQSGGHVRLSSDVGKGTIVRLYLPRSAVSGAAADGARSAPSALPRGEEMILFVEDDPLVRQHTERQIVTLGYRVVTAENAAAALAHVEEGCQPDLLFTDIVMPGGVNGRQLAQKLRLRWPALRVLYTSGYARGTLDVDGEQVPSKYVLGKPYRRSDLANKLRQVLDEPLMEMT